MRIFSQFGDLFASLLKRWAGVKDFSSVFPGHGGISTESIALCLHTGRTLRVLFMQKLAAFERLRGMIAALW
jgi:predicted CDP-diglyceride synthetase/phosphatidate cytidylyltransferase